MWLITMFDLPVGTPTERRRANRFRKFLMDEGMGMKQFSVYQKYYQSRAQAEAAAERIGRAAPPHGQVTIVFITDRQFGMIRNYSGRTESEPDEKPSQLALF